MRPRFLLFSFLLVLAPCVAHAEEPPAPASSPNKIGGHLGLALPLVTFSKETTTLGKDFVNIGIAPGVTVKLSDRWAIDYEFIAFNNFKSGHHGNALVVDPGLVYTPGPVNLGLRVATRLTDLANVGLVPIINKGFKIDDKVAFFVELDLPLFFNDNGREMQVTFTPLLQMGAGF